MILENIKVELSIIKNGTLFKNIFDSGTIFFEEILFRFFNIDVKNAYKELQNENPEFLLDLKCLACSFDYTEYVSDKQIIFIKFLKKYFLKYKENKIIDAMSNIDKEKINDIDKKYSVI